MGRVADGSTDELDKRRLFALGNAVVPQVSEFIGRRLMELTHA
jgi:DNA (cytosine-5)-methyltransferase 1